MSKISDLIKQICPDGVEWMKIGDIAEVNTGSSNGNEAEENGLYPFFVRSQSVKRKNTYEFDDEAIIIPGEGGIGQIFHYIKGKYALHQRVYRIKINAIFVDSRFVYYYFTSYFKKYILQKAVNATVISIRKPMIEDFRIPVPPLSIQQEIVRVLDNFSELTAELQAEMQARKSQYEYYRNQLLSFSDAENSADVSNNKVGWMLLKDVCSNITSGGTPNTGKLDYYGGCIPWLRTQEINFNEIIDTEVKITEEGLKNSSAKWINENCVIVAMYGATVGRTGINKNRMTTNQACCNLEINPCIAQYKYIFHYLSSKYGYIKSLGQGSQTNINANILKKLLIPIPSLPEQARIVSILDRFDKLCNDLSEGLPAEIEARQKQYEYYRDKLLTFKEKI